LFSFLLFSFSSPSLLFPFILLLFCSMFVLPLVFSVLCAV
jgi:hypothetical protein